MSKEEMTQCMRDCTRKNEDNSYLIIEEPEKATFLSNRKGDE